MGNINKIKLPDGNTYNIVDNTSGYTTNLGTITGVSLNGTPVATSGVANIEIAAAAISVSARGNNAYTLNITTNVSAGDEVEY